MTIVLNGRSFAPREIEAHFEKISDKEKASTLVSIAVQNISLASKLYFTVKEPIKQEMIQKLQTRNIKVFFEFVKAKNAIIANFHKAR